MGDVDSPVTLPGDDPVGATVTTAQEREEHHTPGWDTPLSPAEQRQACSLCGSTRATLVFVPDGRLGSDGDGIYRCANATDCKRRAALAEARAHLDR